MHSKTLKFTGLTAAIVIAAGSIAAFSMTSAVATGTGKGERHVMATTINNPTLAQQAGFPASALNVNRTADGRLSWMMTKAEQQRMSDYKKNYLRPAQKQVAAQLVDDGGKSTTASLFGTTDTSTLMLGGLSFESQGPTAKLYRYTSYAYLDSSEPDDEINAPFNLPSGAIITGMTAYGADSSANDDPDYYVFYSCQNGSAPTGTAPQAHVTVGFNGGNYAVSSSTSDLVIDNSDCSYSVQADLSEGTTDVAQYVYGVALRWKRQVSPDPATSTFTDVGAGAPFHREIEALAASGIAAGCGGGKFCPNNTLTRGQMAAFLSRALGLHWENN